MIPARFAPSPFLIALFLAALALAACHAQPASDAGIDAGPPPDVTIPPLRSPGQRAPRTAACDDADGTRCLLPWPSNVFTVLDATTPTGVRVAVAQSSIARNDDAASLNRADGFSRVSPVLTAFPALLDRASLGDGTTGGVRLLLAQPGDAMGAAVPLRFDLVTNGSAAAPQSMIVAYPRVPLAPASEYLAVVLDDVHATGAAAPLAPAHDALVALGLAPPLDAADAALFAYHAPARALLATAGIDPHHVLRLWDFTTRSAAGPTRSLNAMRAAEIAAVATPGVTVAIDTVAAGTGTVALVVEGRLVGLPAFRTTTGQLSLAADGTPSAMGVHDAPFRVAIPMGTGSYGVVMYGHGTGGNFHDSAFDSEITSAGLSKVGMQFIGWTDSDVTDTFANLAVMLAGSARSTAGLLQSLADGMAIQSALASSLGDALSAATLMGSANPVAGRRPDTTHPLWAGGSLGGTMGLVYSSAEPTITAAVLNVPGAAWTHFVSYSTLFGPETLVLHPNYPTLLDIYLALGESQIAWDDADGALWADAPGANQPVRLEQESMGDPVLPNPGGDMVAACTHATQVGAVLNPVAGVATAAEADMHTGFTQYRVPASVTSPLDIHGFAAHDSVAGMAAQQQILGFIQSVLAGSPRITVPPLCVSNTPAGSCDFSGS